MQDCVRVFLSKIYVLIYFCQGVLAYQVVGDLAAPSYFWVDSIGQVFVKNSLKSDITTQYTVSAH